jgi:hypothetical protein
MAELQFRFPGEQMKPIQERAELALFQGLRCVQFRLPNRYGLKPKAYSYAMGLRYGLVGAAAAYFALEIADFGEEREVKQLFQYWPLMVTEHCRCEICYRLPFEADEAVPLTIGKLSGPPLKICLALRKQFLPLDRVLEIASDIFHRDNRFEITSESWLLKKAAASAQFREASKESVAFAAHFFDRRRAGVEEVSEIALLGE